MCVIQGQHHIYHVFITQPCTGTLQFSLSLLNCMGVTTLMCCLFKKKKNLKMFFQFYMQYLSKH